MTAPAQEELPPPSAPELHKKWREDYEVALKRYSERKLVLMLAEIQARLGTSAERTGDVDRCNAIGHRLKNVHAGLRLGESLRMMDSKKRFE
jgi:hypothetical protein